MKISCIVAIIASILISGECKNSRSLFSGSNEEIKTNCINKDVDAYLDTVLEKARKDLPDPMRLPPRSTVVELSDGVLWGMSTIERAGPVKVTCEGSKITIRGKLTAEEIKGRYTWTKPRRRKEDKDGYVVFISDDFEADVEVVIEKREGKENHPRLTRFEIKKFKDAKIEMTGLGLFTWTLGEVTTLMSGIFQRAIGRAIQGPLQEALEREFREINLD